MADPHEPRTSGKQLPVEDSQFDIKPVPVFNCIVYVRSENGRVHARVANLDGFEMSAGSEREVLGKVVTAFKRRVAELHAKGEIPWNDPPAPIGNDEQQRLIPVHL